MAGRRLRETVRKTLVMNGGGANVVVVIAGLSNAYSHYITTYEEYQVQRYEGASTIYGPHTLEAYQQLYAALAKALVTGQTVPPGPTPPNLSDEVLPSFLPPVIQDFPPVGGYFGQVSQDANPAYARGETVTVSFWGANPRNDYMTQSTYLTVEQQQPNGTWKVILNDGDWDTKYFWESVWIFESLVTVTWDIDPSTPSGTYRIRTYGVSKDILGTLTPYTGTSQAFLVQ